MFCVKLVENLLNLEKIGFGERNTVFGVDIRTFCCLRTIVHIAIKRLRRWTIIFQPDISNYLSLNCWHKKFRANVLQAQTGYILCLNVPRFGTVAHPATPFLARPSASIVLTSAACHLDIRPLAEM